MDLSRSMKAVNQAAGPGDGKSQVISGTFDPTALERGAKALKEIDSSGNAAKAFELTKMQEQTKQKEMNLESERMQTAR